MSRGSPRSPSPHLLAKVRRRSSVALRAMDKWKPLELDLDFGVPEPTSAERPAKSAERDVASSERTTVPVPSVKRRAASRPVSSGDAWLDEANTGVAAEHPVFPRPPRVPTLRD